jgi:hypothetical protein
VSQEIAIAAEEINEILKDKKFKETLYRLKAKREKTARVVVSIPFSVILKTEKSTIETGDLDKQKQLANSYNKQIDAYLETLEVFSPQTKHSLDNQMNYATISAGILPLLLTLLSGGLFVISSSLLSFVTNAFSVIPPLFINSIKSKIDGFYKGAKLKALLNDMKYNIERLAASQKLTDEECKSLDEQLKKISEDLSNL